jgi:hypothetical protein
MSSNRDAARATEATPKDRLRPRHAPPARRRSVGRIRATERCFPRRPSGTPGTEVLGTRAIVVCLACTDETLHVGKPTHSSLPRTRRAPSGVAPSSPPTTRTPWTRVDPGTSLRFGCLSTKSTRAIDGRAVLRSQGFSPSQRFSPTRASWPCFMPHPPIGFRPSELLPARQPWHLSTPVPSCRFGEQAPLGFRAFIRRAVRHLREGCSPSLRPLLSWPSPPSRLAATPLGRALPACASPKLRSRVSIRHRLGPSRKRAGQPP